MRIGIEAQRIFRKKKHGMDFVALELIRHLQETDLENEYFVFVQPDEDNTVLQETANFRIIPLRRSPYPVWEQILLPAAVRRYGIELLHCTSNTAPVRPGVPTVITLHDIIYLEKIHFKSGTWYQRLGNLYRRWNVPLTARRASLLFTVSRYEQQRIMDHFGMGEEKVRVVYNGVRPHFRPVPYEEADAIRRQYGLPERYVLFLGNTDPKKNLRGVMAAMSNLWKRGLMDFDLVMPDFGREALQRILAELEAPELMGRIYLTGYVPNADLPALYSRAVLFLYPSLRESFGLPILEAMACACPVITSDTSSMPEVAGTAALLVDPSDPARISEAVSRITGDVQLRERLIRDGLDRAPLFSYARAAESVRSYYLSAGQNSGS